MPTASKKQTDFEETEVVEETVDEQPAAKDEDGIPYCQVHHCRMKRVSGGKAGSRLSYYKCPVPGCECRAQMIRTRRESVVPPNPIACPRCSTDKKKVICVRNESLSNAAAVVLQCPSCGWKSNKLAMPNLAAQHHLARRKEVAGIGDR